MSYQPYRPLPPHVGYRQAACHCPADPECLLNAACSAFPEWAEAQDPCAEDRRPAAASGQLPATPNPRHRSWPAPSPAAPRPGI